MTDKPDLPPSSVTAFTEALKGERGLLDAWLEVNDESEVAAHIEAYASACVSSATAEKDAEIDALRTRLEDTVRDSTNKIEALRAELGCLQQQYDERTACTIVHRGAALACSDAVRAAYSEEHERAERLAEALRKWWSGHRPVGWTEDQHRACPYVNLPTGTDKALAEAMLRDQEEGHEQ